MSVSNTSAGCLLRRTAAYAGVFRRRAVHLGIEGTRRMTSLGRPIGHDPRTTLRQSEWLFVSESISCRTTADDGPGEELWAQIEHMNGAYASSGSDPLRRIGGG